MAYNDGLAELIRGDLTDRTTVEEKHVFGGLCFMLDGHMLYGVNK